MATISAILENMEQEMTNQITEIHKANELVVQYEIMLHYPVWACDM